jgi:quinol monooxygenase YgiN
MAVIVVTRLRLRDPALLDEFFTAAVATLEQAKGSAGCLGADVLADAANTWWTVTSWQDREVMRAFVRTEPHLATMARLDGWCDEATFVDWEQASGDLPGWQACWQRIVADGQVAELSHATAAHATRDFPAPVEAPAS